MNQFIKQMQKHDSLTWNLAISNSTSGSTLLDYFGKAGSYRGRSFEEVFADMSSIFAEDPLNALRVMFYNRMVTRKPKGFNNECDTLHKGQGNKHEFICSLNWLHNNHPEWLYKNLWLIPIVGRWSDLWYFSPVTQLSLSINREEVYKLVKAGLKSEYHRGLIAKHLPKIRSRRHTKNQRHVYLSEFARGLCAYLGWSEADYRHFKSSPEHTAHLWQRQACTGDWDDIDFKLISGKALFNLLSRKGKDGKNPVERHGLEQKYLAWIKSQPVAKFTGYPYELYKKARTTSRSLIQRYTFNSQFEGLLEKARESVPKELLDKGVLCALDTSGSMSSTYEMGGIQDSGIAPIDVCVGLGLYFSNLIEGYFKNHVVMFDSESRFLKLNGEFCDQVDQIAKEATAWGGTNFQSVIDEIIRVRRQNPDIPVEDFPKILLICSDMQWNATGTFETNYEMLMRKLSSVGLPPMVCIWWQCNGQFTGDVPSLATDVGAYMISGMDGAIITSILGGLEEKIDEITGEKRQLNAQEMMEKCLDQEILKKIVI